MKAEAPVQYSQPQVGERARLVASIAGRIAGYGLATALVASPIVAERAIEHAEFDDYLGTLPVEVQLSHNGHSTLDTGILDEVYLKKTGPLGFGITARATGPPEAGETLASFADPSFTKRNLALVDNPEPVIKAYSEKLRDEITNEFIRNELLIGVIGGVVLTGASGRRRIFSAERANRERALISTIALIGAMGLSTSYAAYEFRAWSDKQAITESYPLEEVEGLSFRSPQLLEIAQQVRPFVEKNTERINQRAAEYEQQATTSLDAALHATGDSLMPRGGEVIVLAEADPQGSFVGTSVRAMLYDRLTTHLGPDAIAMRTISGDISSNGTVAEARFIEEESSAGSMPIVAIGGDHDSKTTWEQMEAHGVILPDFETIEVNGLNIAGAHDREHKTLFGGMVTNDSGINEFELGERLRQEIPDDQSTIVLLHQPLAAKAYLRMDTFAHMSQLVSGSMTEPQQDGFANLPPGSVNIGHLHDSEGPWVVWNTDSNTITWTLVDQLGTAGGVEERPTFNRFSSPFSTPLKPLSIRVHFMNEETGLVTGYATVQFDTYGTCTITQRTDVGLPGGEPHIIREAQDKSSTPNNLQVKPRSPQPS